jgi:hypothetical protein
MRRDMKTLPSSPTIQILLDCPTISTGIKSLSTVQECPSTKTRLIGRSNNNDIRPSMLFLFIYLNCILTCPFSSLPFVICFSSSCFRLCCGSMWPLHPMPKPDSYIH